jgi:hypothetical protein
MLECNPTITACLVGGDFEERNGSLRCEGHIVG